MYSGKKCSRYFTQPGEQLVNWGRTAAGSFWTSAVQAEQQFHALFHDRQVGGEIGVEYAVETATPQGRVHLEGERLAGRQSEALADPRPRTGRGLDHDVLGRVVDGLPHFVGEVVGPQGAGRAAVDALSAVDADHVGQRLVHEGADLGLVAAVQGLQHAHLLQVDTSPHAAAAKDALVHVADHGVAGGVNLVPRPRHVAEAEKVHAIFRGQRLEFAVVVARAGVTLAQVAAQEQVEDVAAGAADLGRMGGHADGRRDGVAARRLQGPLLVDLHDADPADPRQAQVFMKAERGDANLEFAGGLQDGRAQGHGDRTAVDGHRDFLAQGLGMFDQLGGPRALAGGGPRLVSDRLQFFVHQVLLSRRAGERFAPTRPRISS